MHIFFLIPTPDRPDRLKNKNKFKKRDMILKTEGEMGGNTCEEANCRDSGITRTDSEVVAGVSV